MALDVDELRAALTAEAVPDDAEPMSDYMQRRFPFLGVRAPAVRTVVKPLLADLRTTTGDELVAFVDRCWDEPEREFQYVGTLLLRRGVGSLGARHLADLERYVTTKSWWDTVDSLAAWSVGPLVRANPELVVELDRWIGADDLWLARAAILHQLSYKADTDAERLFRYASIRAGDEEFFIRKAIGWALRQYAREEPDAVRAFVDANRDRLANLTVREALKHLGG